MQAGANEPGAQLPHEVGQESASWGTQEAHIDTRLSGTGPGILKGQDMKQTLTTLAKLTGKAILIGSLATLTACGGCGSDNNQGNNATPNNTANNTNTAPNTTTQCPDGSADCPCKAGDMCNTGLVCDTGKCVGMTASGLKVSSPDARACELLIEEGTTKVLNATGKDGTKVAFKRRAPNVAVSFMSTTDAEIATGSVSLSSNGDPSGFVIKSAECFGADGAKLESVEVTLD